MKIRNIFRIFTISLASIYTMIAGSEYLMAQNNSTRSPYSRYGIGEFQQQSSIANKGMGGVGIGIRNPYIVNSSNPASYSSVDSMTFIVDMGLSAGFSFLNQGDKKDNKILGNLDYLSILFPVWKSMGMSAGIHPIASRGYLFGELKKNNAPISDPSADIKTENRTFFTGSGNINQIYLGFSSEIYGGISFGFNANYIFGDESRWRQISYLIAEAYNPSFSNTSSIRGFKIDFGAQYQKKWGYDNESYFVLGATFSPKAKVNVKSRDLAVISKDKNTAILGDVDKIDTEYSTYIPMQVGLGASLSMNNNWTIAADAKFLQWKGIFIDESAKARNQFIWNLGGEWIPNSRSRNFFANTSYRIGFNGSNSYFTFPIKSKDESFYNLGANIGMGFPLIDRRSRVNISFDYKYLMPSNISTMINEHYVGISLGILFNGNWFRKAQID